MSQGRYKSCWCKVAPAPSLTIRQMLIDAIEEATAESLTALGSVDADRLCKWKVLEQLDESEEEDKVKMRSQRLESAADEEKWNVSS